MFLGYFLHGVHQTPELLVMQVLVDVRQVVEPDLEFGAEFHSGTLGRLRVALLKPSRQQAATKVNFTG